MVKCCDNCKHYKALGPTDECKACSHNFVDKFEERVEKMEVVIRRNIGCIGGVSNIKNYFRKRVKESLEIVEKDHSAITPYYGWLRNNHKRAFAWLLEDDNK